MLIRGFKFNELQLCYSIKKKEPRSFTEFAVTGYKGGLSKRTFYGWASKGMEKIGGGLMPQDGNVITCRHPDASSMVKVLDFSGCNEENPETQAIYLAGIKKKHVDGRKNACAKQRCVKFCKQLLDRYFKCTFKKWFVTNTT